MHQILPIVFIHLFCFLAHQKELVEKSVEWNLESNGISTNSRKLVMIV